jgi:hypothetical protein
MSRRKTEPTSGQREYVVYGTLRVGVYTSVVASSEREALEIAQGRGVKSVCGSCGSSHEDEDHAEWCLSDNLDGSEVDDLSVDDA